MPVAPVIVTTMRLRVAVAAERPANATLAALIEERRALLGGLAEHPEWAAREADVAAQLHSRLTVDALDLVAIDARTPDAVLEKLVKYEAVHPIRGAQDLERRLAADRRCYAFFHPALADEPLIFTEIALTHCLSADVRALLDAGSRILDPRACNCAIFYSISSCHEGLRGVPLGNDLIQQASREIGRQLPRLDTFATLSPVPSFRSWLESLARNGGDAPGRAAADALSRMADADWHANPETATAMERQLVPLCAYYLLQVKRADEPADAVARFHLRNGARLERINWLGDASPAGMRRAAGMMVNYVYRSRKPGREYDATTSTWAMRASRDVTRLALEAKPLFRT
jgi:malonyl-CoA decarboxylase